ncbi:S1 family peptidase [Streptomyces sp. NBC_00648]|uniref:S1 family peptidase n=1 Tax=Streptomyces sp. NBC_00648 TaxID=2975797 RepID=UPI0032471B87
MRISQKSSRRRNLKGLLAATGTVALIAACPATATAASPAPVGQQQKMHPIIGGKEVPVDGLPFMAALLHKGKGSASDRQFCGGSLIDPETILTAAHCVAGATASKMEVVVGRTVLSNDRQGQVRNVDEFVVHARYADSGNDYDVALITLDKPVEGITPVKLPTLGTDALIRPGALATVAGWGNTDTSMDHFPDRLRQVDVPILSHPECKTSYPDYNEQVNVCAGVEGKDSCQGDSGGPLFRTVPGRQDPIQIGIVSYGDGCGERGAPGVYTSTSSAELWDTFAPDSAAGKKFQHKLGR